MIATLAIDRFAARREPDFIVGADNIGGPYLRRWYVTPWRRWQTALRNRAQARPTAINRAAARAIGWLPNLYVHQFLRDDDDRALHDHPSWAASLILEGYYIEHTIAAGGIHHRQEFHAGALRFLPTSHAHRIELPRLIVDNGDPVVRKEDPPAPCWTLFLFGPTVREWGFHCPEAGWIHWRDFTAPGNPGETGRGCD
ncbi:MAG: hypothetical protein GX761_10055 [Gammaproteobacteria bacterium]|nr:hypothetical protein [Gammaproteobacteria bacterium]